MNNPNTPTEINPAIDPAIETNEPSEAKPEIVESPEQAPAREAAAIEPSGPGVNGVNGVDPTAK